MPRTALPLGLLISQNCSYGALGQVTWRGAMLAVEEVNASGELIIRPEVIEPRGDNELYVSGAKTLLARPGLAHVLGCYTSSSRKEVLPVFEKRDSLLWYPSHYEGFETSENVVYTGAGPNQHVIPLAYYMLSRGVRTAFFIGSNYIWAWENNRIMRELLGRAGGRVLGERYLSVGDTDVTGIVEKIFCHRPEMIFNTLIGESSYAFIRALRAEAKARGIDQPRDLPVVSCSLAEPELLLIGDACDGHLSSSVYFSSVDRPQNRRFLAAWSQRYPDAGLPSADAEAAYIAVHLLALAVCRAGSSAPAEVVAALAEVSFEAPQGSVRIEPENRHAWLCPRIGRSQRDGSFEILHESEKMVAPDPYLVWESSATPQTALGKPRLVS